MTDEQASTAATYGPIVAVALLPIAVNAFKIVVWGYGLAEIWRHLLLDLAVVALLVLILTVEPLKHPIVYGGLFVAFCVSYFNAHPPADGFEWFGSIVALLIVGALIFPRLHKLTPLVIVGLLIAYLAIIRLMLPSMSRAEAFEILAKDRPEVVAAETLHTAFGYERFFIGLEKLRCFLRRDDRYGDRLDAFRKLHDDTLAHLKEQGIDWLYWNKLRHDYEPTRRSGVNDAPFVTVYFKETTVPGKLIERAENGVALDCQARVAAFSVRLERLEDGSFRVVDVPAAPKVERVAEAAPPAGEGGS